MKMHKCLIFAPFCGCPSFFSSAKTQEKNNMTATLEEIGEALLLLSQATTENTKKPAMQKLEMWIQDCPDAVNTAVLHYLQDANEKVI